MHRASLFASVLLGGAVVAGATRPAMASPFDTIGPLPEDPPAAPSSASAPASGAAHASGPIAWYGWQALIVDGFSAVLLAAATTSSNDGAANGVVGILARARQQPARPADARRRWHVLTQT